MSPTDPEPIRKLLEQRYGLAVLSLTRVQAGQRTVNYRARTDRGAFFVKAYAPENDLAAQRGAIGLSELAGAAGAPVAPVLRTLDGCSIGDLDGSAASVWGWVKGEMRLDGLCVDECAQAGEALGIIHRAFAARSDGDDAAPKTRAWFRAAGDIGAVRATIGQIQAVIAARQDRGEADDFDAQSAAALEARLAMIGRLPQLRASLPRLSSQLVHGDYATPNLLFAAERLAAVLDFEPPDPFLPAYDLGRIAFFADTVATRPNWLESAQALVRAYRDANPALAPADVCACGRIWLIQLIRSLYGVREHYLQPAFLQDELDQYWTRRHQTASILLGRLEEVDAMLADVAAAP